MSSYRKDGVVRAPDGSVVIYDGVTMVRIDPAALPAQTVGAVYVPPPPTERSTVGALRAWCEPKDDDKEPLLGTICGVALDWQQAWWTLGQILAPLPDSTEVGLARYDAGGTPSVAFAGVGWDVLIAGLDPHTKEAKKARPVPLAPPKALRMARGGTA